MNRTPTSCPQESSQKSTTFQNNILWYKTELKNGEFSFMAAAAIETTNSIKSQKFDNFSNSIECKKIRE